LIWSAENWPGRLQLGLWVAARAVVVPRRPGARIGDGKLGYLEQAPLPLLVPIERAVLEDGSETLVAATERDELRRRARELTFLGFIESLPNEPVQLPPYTETLRRPVLVRWIDEERRRHTYEALAPSAWAEGPLVMGAELGRLQLDPDSRAIPVRLDAAGRITTDRYSFTEPPVTPTRLVRYAAAPLNWRGFGTRSTRLRATLRRMAHGSRLAMASGIIELAVRDFEGERIAMTAGFGDAAKRGRINRVLFRKHAGGQRVRCIGIEHRDCRLGDNRAFVHRGHHEMHGAAVDFCAVGQGARMCVEAAIGR